MPPIHPLKLGNKTFETNLIQAPLAGYSCAPFRRLAQEWGPPAFCYTEMLSAKNLATQPKIEQRFIYKDPKEGLLGVQFAATDPNDLARAVERAIGFGADLIDLNCGCPVGKIRKKGAGSKLLEDPVLLGQLVKAMKSVSQDIPVSIKIRVDGISPLRYSQTAALIAQDAGIDFITIHGRHWRENYEAPCRQDQIAELIQVLNIPVIANGDASDTESTLNLLKNTGADGVMIGRGGVGQPWLFAQILAESQGKVFTKPSPDQIKQMFLQHLSGLIHLEGEKIAVLQARNLIKYYVRSLRNLMDYIEHAQTANTLQDMVTLSESLFTN